MEGKVWIIVLSINFFDENSRHSHPFISHYQLQVKPSTAQFG